MVFLHERKIAIILVYSQLNLFVFDYSSQMPNSGIGTYNKS